MKSLSVANLGPILQGVMRCLHTVMDIYLHGVPESIHKGQIRRGGGPVVGL